MQLFVALPFLLNSILQENYVTVCFSKYFQQPKSCIAFWVKNAVVVKITGNNRIEHKKNLPRFTG